MQGLIKLTKPNFNKDLLAGQQGERDLIVLANKYGIVLKQMEGRGADLVDTDGNKWECKTDRYDHSRTQNFFIEFIGNIETGKEGGPWKAEKDGCKYFVYYFRNPGIAYVFETVELLNQVSNYILNHNPTLIEIPNKRWTSVGYKVPRSVLSPSRVLHTKAVKSET